MGGYSRAAQPIQPIANQKGPSASVQKPPAANPVSQSNTFEIAPYERKSQTSSQESPADSAEFDHVLRQHRGWTSKLDSSGKKEGELVGDCNRKNRYCDVVSLIEAGDGVHTMTLAVLIVPTPDSHQEMHTKDLDVNRKPHRCDIDEMGGPEACRQFLFDKAVDVLAGLDKTHKDLSGGK
jgi:hypothetical protein